MKSFLNLIITVPKFFGNHLRSFYNASCSVVHCPNDPAYLLPVNKHEVAWHRVYNTCYKLFDKELKSSFYARVAAVVLGSYITTTGATESSFIW